MSFLFSGENKKIILNLLSADIAKGVVKVNVRYYLYLHKSMSISASVISQQHLCAEVFLDLKKKKKGDARFLKLLHNYLNFIRNYLNIYKQWLMEELCFAYSTSSDFYVVKTCFDATEWGPIVRLSENQNVL